MSSDSKATVTIVGLIAESKRQYLLRYGDLYSHDSTEGVRDSCLSVYKLSDAYERDQKSAAKAEVSYSSFDYHLEKVAEKKIPATLGQCALLDLYVSCAQVCFDVLNKNGGIFDEVYAPIKMAYLRLKNAVFAVNIANGGSTIALGFCGLLRDESKASTIEAAMADREAELKRYAEAEAAEAKRAAEAEKAAEAKRISDAKAAEAKRIEDARLAEVRRIEAARAAEAKRISDAQAAEAKRIADEKRGKCVIL
jgi:hypothetical protein